MTPMFIQEPFWELTYRLPDAYYISVNTQYDFLPEQIEDKGMAMLGDIAIILRDVNTEMKSNVISKGSGKRKKFSEILQMP